MSQQGFCSKCGHAYLSDNHLANCFQSSAVDADDKIKSLESQLRETIQTLASERDAFGKRETRLMQQLRAADELAKILLGRGPNESSDLLRVLAAYEKVRSGK